MVSAALTSPPPAPAPPASDGALDVLVWTDQERVFVAPCGEIDLSTVDRVAQRIDEARGSGFGEVVLDLRKVSFMDASGVRLIAGLAGPGGSGQDVAFGVVPGPPSVERVLELTGLADTVGRVAPTSAGPCGTSPSSAGTRRGQAPSSMARKWWNA